MRVPKLWAGVVWLGGGLLYSCVVSWLPCKFAPRECLVQKRRKSTPQVATLQLYRGDPPNRCQVLGPPARPPAPLYRPLGLSPAAVLQVGVGL